MTAHIPLPQDNQPSRLPRATTMASIMAQLEFARAHFPNNKNIARVLRDAHMKLDVLIRPSFCKASDISERNFEIYIAALNVAVMAIRLMEEGDAILCGYDPPDADDVVTRLIEEG